MYAVVGIEKLNNRRVIKILNTKFREVRCLFEEYFPDFEEGNTDKIVNASFSKEKGCVVGTQGSLDRLKDKGTLVILAEYIDLEGNTLGYLSANSLGEIIETSVTKTIRLGKIAGIQNGAIVNKNGKEFIRCIEGRYKVICKNPGILEEKCYQCRVQSMKSFNRKERLLDKAYKGDLLKIKIGG